MEKERDNVDEQLLDEIESAFTRVVGYGDKLVFSIHGGVIEGYARVEDDKPVIILGNRKYVLDLHRNPILTYLVYKAVNMEYKFYRMIDIDEDDDPYTTLQVENGRKILEVVDRPRGYSIRVIIDGKKRWAEITSLRTEESIPIDIRSLGEQEKILVNWKLGDPLLQEIAEMFPDAKVVEREDKNILNIEVVNVFKVGERYCVEVKLGLTWKPEKASRGFFITLLEEALAHTRWRIDRSEKLARIWLDREELKTYKKSLTLLEKIQWSPVYELLKHKVDDIYRDPLSSFAYAHLTASIWANEIIFFGRKYFNPRKPESIMGSIIKAYEFISIYKFHDHEGVRTYLSKIIDVSADIIDLHELNVDYDKYSVRIRNIDIPVTKKTVTYLRTIAREDM